MKLVAPGRTKYGTFGPPGSEREQSEVPARQERTKLPGLSLIANRDQISPPKAGSSVLLSQSMPVDIDYQENRPGGVANHENLLSVAKTEPIYLATQHCLDWRPSPSGEAARAVVQSIELEELLMDAPVANTWNTWTTANDYGALTTCLHVDALERTFEFAGNNAVLTDAAGNQVAFKDKDEALAAFQQMYVDHDGDPNLEIGDNDWDNLEPLALAAAITAYQWIENLGIADFVKTSRTIATYVDYARIAGPRGLDAQRLAVGGQLRFACASTLQSNGGQLRQETA